VQICSLLLYNKA